MFVCRFQNELINKKKCFSPYAMQAPLKPKRIWYEQQTKNDVERVLCSHAVCSPMACDDQFRQLKCILNKLKFTRYKTWRTRANVTEILASFMCLFGPRGHRLPLPLHYASQSSYWLDSDVVFYLIHNFSRCVK